MRDHLAQARKKIFGDQRVEPAPEKGEKRPRPKSAAQPLKATVYVLVVIAMVRKEKVEIALRKSIEHLWDPRIPLVESLQQVVIRLGHQFHVT